MQRALDTQATNIAADSNSNRKPTPSATGLGRRSLPQPWRLSTGSLGRGSREWLCLLVLLGSCGSPNNQSKATQAPAVDKKAIDEQVVDRQAIDKTAVPPQVEASGAYEASVRPDVNERFLDPVLNVQEFVEVFETESREIALLREPLTDALQLQAGERVADLGAGTGLFMDPLCNRVGPTGLVWALDISAGFVEHLEQRAGEKELDMLRPRLVSERSAGLEPDSIDAAFVCDTYHHFEYPASVLASLRSALRPGGRLVIVDFERIPATSRAWVLRHVRCGKAETRAEVEAAGFIFDAEVPIEGLTENYVMRFRNPE